MKDEQINFTSSLTLNTFVVILHIKNYIHNYSLNNSKH